MGCSLVFMQTKKRKLDNGNRADNSDDGDEQSGAPRDSQKAVVSPESPKYACPYFKYNPATYKDWGICPGPGSSKSLTTYDYPEGLLINAQGTYLPASSPISLPMRSMLPALQGRKQLSRSSADPYSIQMLYG